MRIGRRTFILGTGLAAAAPAFANLIAVARTCASPSASPSLSPSPTDNLVFRIDGWSVRDSASIDRNPLPCDEVWISINQSWRTAWR
jgi:hypothetical protein